MKQTFTSDEKELLIEFLKRKLFIHTERWPEESLASKPKEKTFGSDFKANLESAIEKISDPQSDSLNSKEKRACVSCVNENYDVLSRVFQLPQVVSWLAISKQQLELVQKLDICKDLLAKLGYYNKKFMLKKLDIDFRYRYILSTVEKLKMSDTVLLSKTDNNLYYKIEFIYNESERLTIELSADIALQNFMFVDLHGQSIDDFRKNKYYTVTSKSEAKELIANSERKSYHEVVIEFLSIVLN